MLSDEVLDGLMNLHDAFLNASLVQDRMWKEPLEKDPHLFPISDRARFERLWVGLLAVLVESWHSPNMRQTHEYVKQVTDTTQLTDLLRKSRKNGHYDKMVECRHYMFHRDKRKYWDDGRKAPFGGLRFHRSLHVAFSRVLLAAVRKASAERQAGNKKNT